MSREYLKRSRRRKILNLLDAPSTPIFYRALPATTRITALKVSKRNPGSIIHILVTVHCLVVGRALAGLLRWLQTRKSGSILPTIMYKIRASMGTNPSKLPHFTLKEIIIKALIAMEETLQPSI